MMRFHGAGRLLLLLFVSVKPVSWAFSPTTARALVGRRSAILSISTTADNEISTTDTTSVDGMTERILTKLGNNQKNASGVGGAGGGPPTLQAFERTCQNWERLLISPVVSPPVVVTDDAATGNPAGWQALRDIAQNEDKKHTMDVAICGGTLGIFFARALQIQGIQQVGVLEAAPVLQGRSQEWNISWEELQELVELGVLSQQDLEAAVQTEFPACRSGFKNQEKDTGETGYMENGIGYECYTDDVLNLGISPAILLDRVKQEFVSAGGLLYEKTALQQVMVSESAGVALDVKTPDDNNTILTARLVLDCMGNGSPISRQQRKGQKPDGVCIVVGSCATGYDAETNKLGDIIYTNSKMRDFGESGKLQYFWEAFPVGIGRNGQTQSTKKTTYMFTYLDANEKRPLMQEIMQDYWKNLPIYQPSIQNPETDLEFERVLFAFFPTYRNSPLQPAWNRLLAVGDASGIQSPLSFGGFGALTRHLKRISGAVADALRAENDSVMLNKQVLGEINSYTPNLAAAWMFQKAMSVRIGQNVDPDFVNRLLAVNFQVMDRMGQRTIKPFLQDVIRFDGLVASLAGSFKADPTFMPQIIQHVGVLTLAEWVGHVSMMGWYTFLDAAFAPVFGPFVDSLKDEREKFLWKRRMEAWKFGSGRDYTLPKE